MTKHIIADVAALPNHSLTLFAYRDHIAHNCSDRNTIIILLTCTVDSTRIYGSNATRLLVKLIVEVNGF